MNSLQELNGYGSTSVDFNDQKDYIIEFNKSLDDVSGTTLNVDEDSAFLQPAQLVVTTLTSPPNDIVIEVDLSATKYAPQLYGATLVNTGSNTNIIISRLRNGKVVINGIRTKADWDAVFDDVKVQLQADFNTNFTYTTKVFDNLTFFVEWTNTVKVTNLDDFNAPNSFVYNENELLTLSGFQITDTDIQAETYEVSVSIDDSSAGVLEIGTESGNSVTVTGSKAEINNLLTTLTYIPTIDYTDNFNLTYVQQKTSPSAHDSPPSITIPVTIGETNELGIALPNSIEIPKNGSTNFNFQILDKASNIDPNTEYQLKIEQSSINHNLNPGYRGNYTLSNQSYTSNDALDTYNLDPSNFNEFSQIDFGGVWGPLLPEEDFNDQIPRYSLEKYKILQPSSENITYELRLELDSLVGQFYWIPSGSQNHTSGTSMTLTGTKEEINTIIEDAYFRHFNFRQTPAILTYYLSRTDDTTGQTEILYDFTRKVYPPILSINGNPIFIHQIGSFFSSYSDVEDVPLIIITGTKSQMEDALQNDVVFQLFEDYDFSANIQFTFRRLGDFRKTFVEDVDVPVIITPAFLGQEYKGGFYAGEVSYDLNNDATHYLIVQKREDIYQGVIDEKSNNYAGLNRGPTDQLIADTIPTPWNCGEVPNTDNKIYGFPNTENLLQSNCVNNFTQLAKVIAYRGAQGYPDFYIPARKELEHVYTKFKPTSGVNEMTLGVNFLSVPSRTENYTSTDPSQTTVSEFVGVVDGGPNEIDNQAYYIDVDPNTDAGRFHYWTSTDNISTGFIAPNLIDFRNGNVVTDYEYDSSLYSGYIRYIRREPKP